MPPLVLINPTTLRGMLRDRLHFGLLVGALVGSTGMAAFGAWCVPAEPHRTLPRPVWTSPAPVPADDPLGLIPPTALPTR